MSFYLLTYACPNMNHVKVYRFAEGGTMEDVKAYRDKIPGEIGAFIAQLPEDLTVMGPTIVKLYNEVLKSHINPKRIAVNQEPLPDIKKFETLAKGKERLFRAMIDVAVAPPDVPDQTATEAPAATSEEFQEDAPREDPAVPEASEPTATEEGDADMAKKKAKKKSTGGKRASRFQDTDKIRLLVKKNPRREGTRAYNMFEKYSSGMTVAEFVKKGGSTKDLRWDIDAGNISVG